MCIRDRDLGSGATETAETVGGQYLGTGVKLSQQPAHTVPLGCCELVGTLGTEEVGTAYRARQYRPAGADIRRLARIAVEQVGQVVEMCIRDSP